MLIQAVKLDARVSKSDLILLMQHVPEDKSRIAGYRDDANAIRSLIGYAMAKYMIKDAFCVESREIRICRGKTGKPGLEGPYNIHFNISHSGDWVICMVDRDHVGIDVEGHKPVRMPIANRCLANGEYEQWLQRSDENKVPYFFKIWTLKEAYLKALGCGINRPLNTIEFSFDEGKITCHDKRDPGGAKWFFEQYFLEDGYSCAACATHPIFPSEIAKKGVHEFLLELRSL